MLTAQLPQLVRKEVFMIPVRILGNLPCVIFFSFFLLFLFMSDWIPLFCYMQAI